MKQGGLPAIPYENHLLLAVRRQQMAADLACQLVALARETDLPLPTAPRGTPGGDRERLRGIPCAGYGGAIRGTRPGDGLERLDRQTTWQALAELSRDIPGTSPGSGPVAELLRKEEAEAEAATLELVRDRAPAQDPASPGAPIRYA